MHDDALKQIAGDLLSGNIDSAKFGERYQALSMDALASAHVDLDRQRRCGFAEVIFAEGKTPTEVCEIARQLAAAGQPVMATRVSADQAAALRAAFPACEHNEVARTVRMPAKSENAEPSEHESGCVKVISAGTSDQRVAEEAAETLRWMGVDVQLLADAGVAGPHRLAAHAATLQRADAIVVVAGMEGALPSVVGGYVACPVFAVPTSVGYGASFGGLAALLGMLNSCAANVAVVNIDAGFKAGYLAGLVATGAARFAGTRRNQAAKNVEEPA